MAVLGQVEEAPDEIEAVLGGYVLDGESAASRSQNPLHFSRDGADIVISKVMEQSVHEHIVERTVRDGESAGVPPCANNL